MSVVHRRSLSVFRHFHPIHARSEFHRGAMEDVQKIHRKLSVPKRQRDAKIHTHDAEEKRDSGCKN